MTTLELFALNYALNAAWQIPLLFLAGWLAVYVLQGRSAAAELRIWSGAIALQTLLPATSLLVFPQRLRDRWDRLLLHSSSVSNNGHVTAHTGPAVALETMHLSAATLHLVFAAFLACELYFTARLAWSLYLAHRLLRGATPLTLSPDLESRWLALCQAMHVHAPRIAESNSLSGPVVAGLRGPTLLVPAGFLEGLNADELDAVFAHELAHIRRRDVLRHLGSEFFALPARFHPLAQYARTRRDEAREQVCDAMAADVLGQPQQLAYSLVRLATRIQQQRGVPTAHALGIFEARSFRTSSLERRIMNLTHPPRPLPLIERIVTIAAMLVFMACITTTAFALHLGIAGATPQAAENGRIIHATGGIIAGRILYKVSPKYPADAKAAGIQGVVRLHAIIGKDGHIKDLSAISGPDELAQAAIEAVKQWVYRPYLLNGNAVEVDTTITVNFALQTPPPPIKQ